MMTGQRPKGKKLATGHGVSKMLDKCYKKGWTPENTILWVENTSDLESKWEIYTK